MSKFVHVRAIMDVWGNGVELHSFLTLVRGGTLRNVTTHKYPYRPQLRYEMVTIGQRHAYDNLTSPRTKLAALTNPSKTNDTLLYLKTQFVPRSKAFSSV
jgi:hypothetical protein